MYGGTFFRSLHSWPGYGPSHTGYGPGEPYMAWLIFGLPPVVVRCQQLLLYDASSSHAVRLSSTAAQQQLSPEQISRHSKALL